MVGLAGFDWLVEVTCLKRSGRVSDTWRSGMEVEDGIKMYSISVETIYLENSLVRLETLHSGPFSQTHF